MALLHYLSFIAIIAAFAFVTLSLASGLLYVSELIEEHSRDAKLIGQRGIYAIITLHILLYLSDALPLPQILFSIICHLVYLQNFSANWPFINLTSLSFVASCLLVVTDHFLWFFWFARVSQEARHTRHKGSAGVQAPGFAEIATFFGVCVWLVPLFLFLSLSAGDRALPTAGQASPAPAVHTPSHPQFPTIPAPQPAQKQHTSLFKSLFSFIPFMPSKRDASEGIIAPRPRTPSIRSVPPSPVRAASYSLSSSGSPIPPPPSSPGGKALGGEGWLTPKTGFQLGIPPPRRGPASPGLGPVRRATSGEGGLGIRRSPSRGYD